MGGDVPQREEENEETGPEAKQKAFTQGMTQNQRAADTEAAKMLDSENGSKKSLRRERRQGMRKAKELGLGTLNKKEPAITL